MRVRLLVRSLAFACVVAGMCALARPARAEPIFNGGFEVGDFSGWTQGGNTAFTSVVTGGVVIGSSVLINGPHSGSYWAQLGPSRTDGTLLQATADVTAGATYKLSFWLASDGNVPNDFAASFNGTTLLSLTNVAPIANWKEYSYDVRSTGTTANVQFAFRNDPGFLGLDDVSLTLMSPPPGVTDAALVPLPAALYGGMLLLGGIGARRLRQRRTT